MRVSRRACKPHSTMKKALFYETEKALPLSTIKVTVVNEGLDAEGLAKKIREGDEIYIKMNNQ